MSRSSNHGQRDVAEATLVAGEHDALQQVEGDVTVALDGDLRIVGGLFAAQAGDLDFLGPSLAQAFVSGAVELILRMSPLGRPCARSRDQLCPVVPRPAHSR